MNLRSYHLSSFSSRLQNLPLPKRTTRKKSFAFVKMKEVVLDHDRDSTMISHDESLEMENPWAMEFCEAPTLESDEKDSTDEHRTIIFEIPCSFNATPEPGMLSAPCTHEDYNHLMVLFCKTFRRLIVDVYVYRKHCRFRRCTVALIL